MGLDMYLYRKSYLNTGDFYKPEHRQEITLKKGGVEQDSSKIKYVTEEVAYWRKANAIHKWFVDHVQNGEDDCREYEVQYSQLETLREVCRTVLNDLQENQGSEMLAEATLPTKSGFFFGSTDYDEGYEADLKYTIETIDKILAEPMGHVTYTSSW